MVSSSEHGEPDGRCGPVRATMRVVRVDRTRVVVGDVVDDTLRTHMASVAPAVSREHGVLATGDTVDVDCDRDGHTVVALHPRTGLLSRASVSRDSGTQVIASGVDTVVIVVPLTEPDAPGLIERFLAVAWESGAEPVVCLTKADLVDDPAMSVLAAESVAPGARVVAVSAESGEGIEELRAMLGPTAALVGQSGVGKSTLANALRGVAVQATAAVRGDGKGRHTTTSRELVWLGDGQCLIDTPGVRSVGVAVGAEALEAGFADVEELIEQCRFADCSHDTEPGCAVNAALDSGDLDRRRFENYGKLQREAAYQAMRGDKRAMSENRKKWKAMGRLGKEMAAFKRGQSPS